MATTAVVHVATNVAPTFAVRGLKEDAAIKTSQLLQENHDKHHIFFNVDGFHNHIMHHSLALYAIGASPASLQKQYDNNSDYQLPPKPVHEKVALNLGDPAVYKAHLGKDSNYQDYLVFFKREIDRSGCEAVIKEYLLKQDDRANDLLARLFNGFYHPLIHLGCAIEFRQPILVAEALAETCVHSNWIAPFFHSSESAAAAASSIPSPGSKSLIQLGLEARADPTLAQSAHYSDANKIRDGILVRAPSQMTSLAAQFRVQPSLLSAKIAESVSFAAFMTATAQRPEKAIKMDFFYMHAVNSAILLQSLLSVEWLSAEDKCRLLEWKGRGDLALYVSRGAPELRYEEVAHYNGGRRTWAELFEQVAQVDDDGHVVKFLRALAWGEKASGERQGLALKKGDWIVVANMVMDSVLAEGPRWVRSCGWEEAWKDVPSRKRGGAGLSL